MKPGIVAALKSSGGWLKRFQSVANFSAIVPCGPVCINLFLLRVELALRDQEDLMATVSFAADILPLFTTTDISHMQGFGVMLGQYSYMSVPANAQNVLDHLDGTTPPLMPPPPASPWTTDQINLFKAWMAGGYQP